MFPQSPIHFIFAFSTCGGTALIGMAAGGLEVKSG